MWEVSWHKQRTHVHYSLVPLQRFDLARHHSCTKHVRLDDFKLGSHSSHDTLNYSISRRCKCTWPVYTQEMTTTLTHLNLFEVPPWLMTSCQRVLPLRYRPRSWRNSDLEKVNIPDMPDWRAIHGNRRHISASAHASFKNLYVVALHGAYKV